jgi:predicted DCC family thiol-disulfide oxidoreductase YuxK
MSRSRTEPLADWDIEVFYDGACPLCLREIRFLRRWDRRVRIQFRDIASADFKPSDYGKTLEMFMSEIHGRLPDGTWIRGVDVFRRLYTAIGLGPLVWITRLPVVAGLLDRIYRVFARNRLRLTRRCSTNGGKCGISTRGAGTNASDRSSEGPATVA